MLWLFLLLIVLVLFLSGAFNGLDWPKDTDKQPNALDILNERYARGELSTDEYDAMKKKMTT